MINIALLTELNNYFIPMMNKIRNHFLYFGIELEKMNDLMEEMTINCVPFVRKYVL